MPSIKKITLNDIAEYCGVSYQTVSRVINQHPNIATNTRERVLKAIQELGYETEENNNAVEKRTTLYDVAERSGVSYQTVSRVINDDPRVAPETRQRIQKAIQELNYRPSQAARSLASKNANTIAIITYGVGNYGPVEMLLSMESHAHSLGYELVSSYVDPYKMNGVTAAIDRLMSWSINGVILIAPIENKHYDYLMQELKDIPIVYVDNDPQLALPSVFVDQYRGMELITQHLLSLGHQRICEIRGPEHWLSATTRHQAIEHTLAVAGLELVSSKVGDWSPKSGYEATIELLRQHDFTAIIAANDHMALGALNALYENHYRVPEDISVTGFDAVSESTYFIPPLTTVKQDFVALGMTALQYLFQIIHDPKTPVEQKFIPPSLIIRNSSAVVLQR